MLLKITSLVLVVMLAHESIAAQSVLPSGAPQQKVQQVLQKAQIRDKEVKVTLLKTIEGRSKIQGTVSKVSESDFTLVEHKTGTLTTIAYADVLAIKQAGMSKAAKVGIGVGVAVGALILVAVLATKPWRSE
jgi:hypothetical protein